MIRLTTNFEFNSDMPLDYRMNFDKLDQLLSFPVTDLPLGIFSTVKANNTTYQFVGKDVTSTGWKEVFRNGNFLVTADGISYNNPNTGSSATTIQLGMEELRRDLNNHVQNSLWRENLSSSADLPPVGTAVYGEAHVVGGNSIYVFDGVKWINLIDTHVINDATISASGLMSAADKNKVDKIIISDDAGDKFLANDGTYKTVAAQLSASDAAKLAVIVADGTGTKFLANDGTYKVPSQAIPVASATENGLMASGDKVKVDIIQNTGLSEDSNKFLSADGTYHNVDSLSVADRTKLDKITTGGAANTFLNGEGDYVTVVASLDTASQEKIDAIVITSEDGDEKKFLNQHGDYTEVIDTLPIATSMNKGVITAADKAKIDIINVSDDPNRENYFLAEDGTYKTVVASLAQQYQDKINKLVIDEDGKTVLTSAGTYVAPDTLIDLAKADTSDDTQDGNDGLMSKEDKAKIDAIATKGDGDKFLADDGEYKIVSIDKVDAIVTDGYGDKFLADDGDYKTVVDIIPVAEYDTDGLMSSTDKTNLDSLVAQIDTTGDGDKFLSDDGTYKEVQGKLVETDQEKLDKVIIDDEDGDKFLANDGSYKNVTSFVDVVTEISDGLMLAADKVNLNKVSDIIKDTEDATKFLCGDGTYKEVIATATTIAAANTTYDNATSKLTATDVQAAIDEIVTGIPLIDDSASTTDFTKLLSAGKVYDLLDTKAAAVHTHVCDDITDLTAKYYDKIVIDQKIADVTTGIVWQESVATYTDIPLTYAAPEVGWMVTTLDTQQIYRYNGSTWEKFGSMAIQSEATHTEKGLMSAADKVKLDKVDETAPRIYYQSTTPPLINGTIWVEE